MSILLCSFASPRSSPEKIQRWIAYLESKMEAHRHEPDSVRMIQTMLAKARLWT